MKNILIIGGIIIVVLVGLFFLMGGDEQLANNDNDNTADEMANDENGNNNAQNGGNNTGNNTTPQNSVVLAENETGNFANVARATLTQPGFIAVYKVNSNGATSPMGTSDVLAAGTYTDIQIQLDTMVAKEETIVAVLHTDMDGEADTATDDYMMNGSGTIALDVDVVDTKPEDEADTLQAQVEAYLESEGE